MAYTVQNLKDDLVGMIHAPTNKVINLDGLIKRAANNLLLRIDPPDTIKSQQITNALYDEIYDYTCPSDLKGKKVIDIRPQVNRTEADNLSQRFINPFDLRKPENTFNIYNRNGEKVLRVSKTISPSAITLHDCDGITDDGTWAVGGGATNLTQDSIDYMSGSASLNFDVLVTLTTGYLENSTFTDVDLEDYDEQGAFFARTYLPDASAITNVILRWGNDSSNYWHRTVTTPHDATAFKDGWNILKFEWNGATEVGTVVPSAIDYLRVTWTYDGVADTDLRLDRISFAIGKIWEIVYYSAYLFKNTSNVWSDTISADDDTIMLDNQAYNLLLNEVAMLCFQQMEGSDAQIDADKINEDLYGIPGRKEGLYDKYEEDNPSEAVKPIDIYYRIQ